MEALRRVGGSPTITGSMRLRLETLNTAIRPILGLILEVDTLPRTLNSKP